MNKDESLISHAVPINVKQYGSVLMFSFKKINGYQAVGFASVSVMATYSLLNYLGLFDIPTNIGIAIVFGAVAGILALLGVRGDTLFATLRHFVLFKKNKKTTYYNPRVKLEQKSIKENPTMTSLLPREKVINAYKAVKNKINEQINRKGVISHKTTEENNEIVFADDIQLANSKDKMSINIFNRRGK